MVKPSFFLGASYTAVSTVLVALMAVLVKWAAVGFSDELLMEVRWGMGLLVATILFLFSKNRFSLKTSHPFLQIGVALSWVMGIFSFYLSLSYIPLMNAALLLNTSSIFAPILIRVLCKEKEHWLVWVGCAVGFLGVVIVLNPTGSLFQPMAMLGLAAGLGLAFRMVFNRMMGPGEPKHRTSFYSLGIGFLFCLLVWMSTGLGIHEGWRHRLFTNSEILQPGFVNEMLLLALIALGVLCFLQPLLVAMSVQRASIGQIAPFRYTGVIAAAMLDWLIWNHVPALHAFIGFGVIFAGGMLIVYANQLQRPKSEHTIEEEVGDEIMLMDEYDLGTKSDAPTRITHE